MADGDFKDLARRTASDKVLCNQAINIAKNPKYVGYQRGLPAMVYKFFDKKSAGGAATRSEILATQNKSAIIQEQQLVEELRKPIIRKFEKRKVHSSFKDKGFSRNIRCAWT